DRPAVDARTGDADEEAAVEARVARAPRAIANAPIEIHVPASLPRTAAAGWPETDFISHNEGMADEACGHISAVTSVKHAKRREGEERGKIGGRWVPLRTCQTCGETLCCDNSPNRHATKHAKASGHPVIASAEPGERWLYCYPDDAFAEY